MGGFLLYRESITISKENQFPSPSQGIGGGPTNIEDIPMMPPAQMFLTSHEGWVGSYLTGHNINICDHKGFPSPLEVWVGSYKMVTIYTKNNCRVSVPSRGMGGFLPC